MSVNNFILECEKDNNRLRKDVEYYKNKSQRLEKKNKKLKEEIHELELIIGLREKRTLIRQFDREFDLEDKKKNPNRDYVAIHPDAEEVYRRYYKNKDNWNSLKEFVKKAVDKYYDSDLRIELVYENVLNKIQELEKGGSNE